MAWDKVSPTQWMSGTNISGQVLVPKEGALNWMSGTNISGQVLVPKEGVGKYSCQRTSTRAKGQVVVPKEGVLNI